MDRLIKRFDAVADNDLMLCEARGVAYQRNMGRGRIAYDGAYYEHYCGLEGSPIATALNDARLAMLARHMPAPARVLDVGVGSGAFLRAARGAGYEAKGRDVNPHAIKMLEERRWLAQEGEDFDAVTFWDSLEHIEEPEEALKSAQRGAVVLVAVPLFKDLRKVRESKHYKPGEHLYYWTRDGFLAWMEAWGFRLLEESSHEVKAGRESIGAFAFKRDLPDYRDHIAAYAEMHATRHYGSSASELHLDMVAGVVRANRPRSILDFGCGRSDLAAYFYLDGRRRIAQYDPAIPRFRDMPEESFDLVLCCDVLEHIPLASVDKVLRQVQKRGGIALFTISIKLARARLPDGRNAHVTILTRSEWERWVRDVFGHVIVLPTRAEHEVNLLAGKRATSPSRYHPCHCGGEVYLDSYNPVRRPVEWFMRCRKCGGMSAACPTERSAEESWSSTTITRTGAK